MKMRQVRTYVYSVGDGLLDDLAKSSSPKAPDLLLDPTLEVDDAEQGAQSKFSEERDKARSELVRYYLKEGAYYSLPGSDGMRFSRYFLPLRKVFAL